MALCARISRLILPGAMSRKSPKTVPPRRPRVNGWSQPVHYLQVMAWIMFLVLAFTAFGIFIPLLPPEWRYIAYSVTGGICLFHLLVHLIVVSIDPAEANVRLKKNYARVVLTFDRSKHAHVIQRQYCHLCKVPVTAKAKHCSACNKCVAGFDHHCKWLNNCVGSRNYWYFFTTVASASAGLLYTIAILLYTLIQYFISPASLRTDPHYRSISDQNTWLLFLPLFPVRTSTPVFLGIGVLVLLLELISLLLLGHLLFFHVYLRAKKLSTYDYIMQNYQQQSSKPPAVKRDVTSEREELSQQLDNHLRSSVQGRKKLKEFLPTSMHLRLCSTAVKPEDTSSSSSKQPVASLSSSVHSVKLTEQNSTISILGESSSGLQELDANLSSSTVGVKWKEFLSPPSRCSSETSLRTIGSESSLQLQDANDQQEIRQHMEGDMAENQGSASGAQGPALTESPFQGSFSASMLPVESVPENYSLLSSLHGHRKDTWSQRHWDTLPGSQKPWSLESTVINVSGKPNNQPAIQEVPRAWATVPYIQMPKGLPVIEEEECGMMVTPVVSVEEGCGPEEATGSDDSRRVTVIVTPEDPELKDRAPQPL
ncbi:probable palmitoyltransferase ZDHHC11B isoform X2 [Balaenoptera musculus]|uniref:Palmitoyltransferase n=1 Tax=Balaenoptera musculus TaxID=9771 RepID=A0A8B8X265_BALMU|nr:probable palmitoyltransferase ZDHHC11B isoform X2 [Balaenoptera musculus]